MTAANVCCCCSLSSAIAPRFCAARDNLNHGSSEQRAYALEVVDVLAPSDLKPSLMSILEDGRSGRPQAPPPPDVGTAKDGADGREQSLAGAESRARQQQLLLALVTGRRWGDSRLPAYAVHALGALGVTGSDVTAAISAAVRSSPHDQLLAETANWALGRLGQAAPPNEGDAMLSTIEKVIILRGVPLFAETPNEILTELAALLTEVELPAGATLFNKGDPGDCMYIVVSGQVRVHDGEQTINLLNEGDIFGEMAILDPGPRMASVSAVTANLLLRLDQDALNELMEERSEIARGIIRVLSRRLRARVEELNELRSRLAARTAEAPKGNP